MQGTLLKKPDLTLQTFHGYCSTCKAAKLQKYKLNTPTLVVTECSLEFHPGKNPKVQEKTAAHICMFLWSQAPIDSANYCPAPGKKVQQM